MLVWEGPMEHPTSLLQGKSRLLNQCLLGGQELDMMFVKHMGRLLGLDPKSVNELVAKTYLNPKGRPFKALLQICCT